MVVDWGGMTHWPWGLMVSTAEEALEVHPVGVTHQAWGLMVPAVEEALDVHPLGVGELQGLASGEAQGDRVMRLGHSVSLVLDEQYEWQARESPD